MGNNYSSLHKASDARRRVASDAARSAQSAGSTRPQQRLGLQGLQALAGRVLSTLRGGDFSVHIVRRNETLTSIASQHGVAVEAIAAANHIKDRNKIVEGQHLRIPGNGETSASQAHPRQRAKTAGGSALAPEHKSHPSKAINGSNKHPASAKPKTAPGGIVKQLDAVESLKNPSTFKIAMQFSMRWEGGYSNDAKDRGGETKYGISKNAYPHEDIKKLTLSKAVDIYKKDYWDKLNLDVYKPKAAIVLMDIAMNHGIGRAKQWISLAGDADALLNRRVQFYHKIVQKDPTQAKFLKGWLNRVNSLRNFISDK
jgi:murein DD-endopeptidase MepM/ murein hydrolase activator NlpD